MARDVLMILLGWAIPGLAAWVLSKIPVVNAFFTAHKQMKAATVTLTLSILASITTVFLYDRFFLTPPPPFKIEPGSIVFTDENGKCPEGWADGSTVLLPRWHEAPHKYQTPKDALNPQWFDQKHEWFVDHAKLCTKI